MGGPRETRAAGKAGPPGAAEAGLAERFEAERRPLRALAHRMLGSRAEAEDAVQEAWLRLSRVDADAVENLPGWLRTVVTRICLDALRARRARPEEPAGEELPEGAGVSGAGQDPEEEALRAEEVGRALLVVLERLGPAERVAFVLHDTFAVPFEEIAPLVGRTPVAAKQLASRARRRVRGAAGVPQAELARQRRVVEAFLAASRGGDVAALLAVLAPDVVRRADAAALPPGRAAEARGARRVAEEIAALGGGALFAEPALVNGRVGAVVAPGGRLRLVLSFAFTPDGGAVAGYEVIATPERLRRLTLALVPAPD
ncbi:sigma-70 family RNA polymerase sigma factor [Streptomyces sp. DSM 44917]|uniref:Sigma-70 family RNA polymerase sigma factor n=1 Tax=Streptomyces boetiae TaxID=3075541 RepID=A0ABU2LD20_9ACTN|nr:sigma-70 family RNA polymerase sigma factor [Streptomyces sp. DSM 44917]MDT0309479.1 sigma-70 family RNA polymerase sigma factor [Streptomyces sp. DSM 44917]